MLEERVDTRADRHEATRKRILEAAWKLARRDGLGALSLREIARDVGMRAPSLYTYFDSKHALYDAMYAEAVVALRDAIRARPIGKTPRETLRNLLKAFLDHTASDPIRYQMVLERPIPGFEPSPESFALSFPGLALVRADLEAAGVQNERGMDLYRAVTIGMISLQIANDPGGDRWLRLIDDALDMFLSYQAKNKKGRRR